MGSVKHEIPSPLSILSIIEQHLPHHVLSGNIRTQTETTFPEFSCNKVWFNSYQQGVSRSDLRGKGSILLNIGHSVSPGVTSACITHEPTLPINHRNTLESHKAPIWKKLSSQYDFVGHTVPSQTIQLFRTIIQILHKHKFLL